MTTAHQLLARLGVPDAALQGGTLTARSPIDGATLAQVHEASVAEVQQAIGRAHTAQLAWRDVPAPRRGELVRLLGMALREHKSALAALVTLEAGKVTSEGEGEVQEMIDICDFAVGLSRQLHGLTIASERPGHRMMEQWHPLGVVGVISAFNFPNAVWAWNAMLAAVCGDTVVWKPSLLAPIIAIADFTGTGFASTKFTCISGRLRLWMARAPAKSPRSAASTIATISAGIWFDATEMTPCPPTAISGSVSASSPERTMNDSGTSLQMSTIWLMFPDASLTPMMFGSVARRASVDGSMFTPARPGTL